MLIRVATGYSSAVSDQPPSPVADQPPLHVFVEIPKGSRNKYEWDPELQAIKLDRYLFSSVVYPTDYGFVPDTAAADGDPLDALVCVTDATFPGCVVEVNVVGMLRMSDDAGQDDKIVCVALHDPNWGDVETLPDQLISEIEHFFSIYKQPEGKDVEITGWYGVEEALAEIESCRARWREERED